MEGEVIINHTPALEHKLTILRAHYNEQSANKALTNLNKLKQSFYDQGEEAGKLLAWRIKKLQNEKIIHEIENSIGVVTNDQKEINERFKIYYEKLYKSELPSNTNKITRTSFLDSLDFPTQLLRTRNFSTVP